MSSNNRDTQIIGTAGGWIVGALLALAFCLGAAWLIQGNDFFVYRAFAPRYEQVRRETFEQSKAYNQGMVQELQTMQFEYLRTDAGHKAALSDIILHRAADYDEAKLPPDLRRFVDSLRSDRLAK